MIIRNVLRERRKVSGPEPMPMNSMIKRTSIANGHIACITSVYVSLKSCIIKDVPHEFIASNLVYPTILKSFVYSFV